MKNIYFLLIAAFSLIAFNSCDDDKNDAVVNITGATNITAPAANSSYVLSEETASDEFEKFTWSDANFGFQAAINYDVQIDLAGNEFENALSIGTNNKAELSLTNAEINQKLLAFGLVFGVATDLEVRVIASVSDIVETVVSDTIAFTVTPYEVVIEYPSIYIPGSYQQNSGYSAGNWSPADAPKLHSFLSNDIYEGYVYMSDADAQFKFTAAPNWDLAYGDTDADGTLESDNGANIITEAAGMYKFKVNIADLTYTIETANFGVIGSGTPTGWDSDTDMIWDAENQVYTLTLDIAADSEGSRQIKFRANDDWPINLGDNSKNGTLVAGGENIDVDSDGNYTISVDLKGPVYKYSLTKN